MTKQINRYTPALDRFNEGYTPVTESGCWIWIKSEDGKGYGQLSVNGKTTKAYRFSYVAFIGPIPEGKELDHLCRVRSCVNPLHLEAVTRRVNQLRGETVSAKFAARTICDYGHPFSGDNVRFRETGDRRRYCVQCKNRHDREYDKHRKNGNK